MLAENWFFVDEKEPVAHALVEVVEASDVKPSDLNGWSENHQVLFSSHIVVSTKFYELLGFGCFRFS